MNELGIRDGVHSFILGTWPRASFSVLYRMLSDLRRRKIKRFALMMVTGKAFFFLGYFSFYTSAMMNGL